MNRDNLQKDKYTKMNKAGIKKKEWGTGRVWQGATASIVSVAEL